MICGTLPFLFAQGRSVTCPQRFPRDTGSWNIRFGNCHAVRNILALPKGWWRFLLTYIDLHWICESTGEIFTVTRLCTALFFKAHPDPCTILSISVIILQKLHVDLQANCVELISSRWKLDKTGHKLIRPGECSPEWDCCWWWLTFPQPVWCHFWRHHEMASTAQVVETSVAVNLLEDVSIDNESEF